MTPHSPSPYCENADEACRVLGLKSCGVLYRRISMGQVAGVIRLKEEGFGPKGRKKHGSLHFIRAELALRETPPGHSSRPGTDPDCLDDPRNWNKWPVK